jgi:hypothetical protein
MLNETLYILTRTSGRPKFFARCRETIKALAWPGPVVHIVHTDDPRDTYVDGDIIVKGETYGPSFGTGFYNLYNNRLLKAIPAVEGWVHFMDDDDEYVAADSMNWLAGENRGAVHVCKTRRAGVCKSGEIFPAQWKKQTSFQTECFAIWSSIAKKFDWWGNKGGDHQYTRKITRRHPIIWHDLIATQAQSGKGNGHRFDADGEPVNKRGCMPADTKVYFKMFATIKRMKQTQLINMDLYEAEILENRELGRITFKGCSREGLE